MAIDTVEIRAFMSALRDVLEIGQTIPLTMVDVMIESYEVEEKESGEVRDVSKGDP